MAVKAVPEGWHALTPRLFVHQAAKLVDFLKYAFGATGTFRTDGPSEIRIGDSIVMVGEVAVREATPTLLATFGRSQLTRKICHSTRSANAPRPQRDSKSLKGKIMRAKVNPIPEGECAATPDLIVQRRDRDDRFLQKVFGAIETIR